jgi:dihydroorotate dehydrogenase electron transfer subunit
MKRESCQGKSVSHGCGILPSDKGKGSAAGSSWLRCSGLVEGREKLSGPYVRLWISARDIAERAQAGQFVHVYPVPVPLGNDLASLRTADPLLRRPFSIHDVDNSSGEIAILFKVTGKGTEWLSRVCPGDLLDIVGPVGRGFPVGASLESLVRSKRERSVDERFEPGLILVGGGVGVAPLILAARQIPQGLKVSAFVGGLSAPDVLCAEELRATGAEVLISTEDGSLGIKGLVTSILEDFLDKGHRGVVFACGPTPMLSAVTRIAGARDVPVFLSLEGRLGCGVGACLGCAVRVTEPDGSWRYLRLCTEGPVIEGERVDFDETRS